MRLFILLAALFVATQSQVINGDECDNDNFWYFSGTSCYKFIHTESSWNDARTACESNVVGDKKAQLVVFSGEVETENVHNLHLAHAQASASGNGIRAWCDANNCLDAPGATYWTAGTPSGWQGADALIDYGDPDVLACGFDCFASGAISCDSNDENCVLSVPASDPYLTWNTLYGTWDWAQNNGANDMGYICEYQLTTCTGPDSSMRIDWQSTAQSTTRESDCPTGYSGTATRQCQANLVFAEVDTTECAALVGDSGWSHSDDGGENNLDDGFGWSSVSAITGTADGGVEYTKKFVLDSVSADKSYIEIRVGVESVESSGGAGDHMAGTFEFTVDGNTVHNTRAGNTLAAEGTADVWIVIPISSVPDDGTAFEIGVTGAPSSGDVYQFTSMSVTPVTRQGMSEACYREMAYNEATAHPNFEKADSGFLTAADDLTFTFTVPRELYDVEIYFEGQTADNSNIGFSGDYDASLWATDVDTSQYNGDADSCGSETWAAAVPWTSMDGVFTSVASFDSNSTTTVDNSNEDYYVFIATMNITAKEKLIATSDLSGRTWPLVRTMHWKYPFALKWLRDISVTSDLEVHVCTSDQTICTIRHVTAIISYIQTDINPIANLAGEDGIHGTVVVGVKTLVAYPYMFVHDEDPQFNPDANDQISNSSLTDYTHSDTVSGWLPEVAYTPVANPDKDDGSMLSVVSTVEFTYEERSTCEHDTTLSVNAQADKECEQNWAVTITPQVDSCFVDGSYTITWSARCFYDKPVCNFPANDAGTGYNNYVSSTLELKSTRMCPKLVQDVDLSGALCSTGLAVEGASYTTGCDSDPTYIQGESTHFYATIDSSLAKIVKTEVTRIQYSQQYDFSGVSSELMPRYDANLATSAGEYADLFVDGSATSLSFTDQYGEAVTDPAELVVVEDVQDSDACQQIDGASCSDAGFTEATEAGFLIKLNSLIFPAPADGKSQVHFRTVLRTTYEGFENFDLTEGVLDGDTLGGTDDAQWCAPSMANDYGGSAALFCANHPSNADLETLCPSICPAGRRRLFTKEFENRRHLQQTGEAIPINDDTQESLFVATINVQSAKAQITGHIDEDANQVDFTMFMIIDQDKLNDYNTQRPTFYEEMEYQLGAVLGALTEQFTVHSIQRVDHGNQPALEIQVQIKKLDGLEDSKYLPSSIAKRLELLIQTGRLYDEDYFHLTAVYNMEYHENDETPHKVHFGEIDPVDTMPDDSVYTISLALICILFALLW